MTDLLRDPAWCEIAADQHPDELAAFNQRRNLTRPPTPTMREALAWRFGRRVEG